MQEEMLQMVDEDEVENVGIMSGFMDDLDELMAEITEEEMAGETSEDADTAVMMSRTPDSPEILMNNLRGNMRSIDARREELADLVGYNAAAETPEGVLALLQPVLAQQEAVPPMPMGPPPGIREWLLREWLLRECLLRECPLREWLLREWLLLLKLWDLFPLLCQPELKALAWMKQLCPQECSTGALSKILTEGPARWA